jgi:hypothetical protein
MRLRQYRWALVPAVAVGLLVSGYALGQRAGGAGPVELADTGPVTAAVERRVLQDTLFVEGDLQPSGATFDVISAVTTLPAVITAEPPEQGEVIERGELLAEVSGRPVFGLSGGVPAYRDLAPGSRGVDVRQLEQTLQSMSLFGPEPDDSFDGLTSAAVAQLYAQRGYIAPPAGTLPLAEYAFVAGPRWVVLTSEQRLGQPVPMTLVGLGIGAPALAGVVTDAQAGLLRAGMPATLTTASGSAEAKVLRVEPAVEGQEGRIVVISPAEDNPLPVSDIGGTGQAGIVLAESPEPVLVVPLMAVVAVSGGDVVRVLGPQGQVAVVPVRVGLVSSGAAAIEPVSAGTIRQGDEVVVR